MSTKILYSREEIKRKVASLADQISKDYKNKKVILVGILDGSFIFMADLARALFDAGLTDFEVNFIGISSYSENRESSKNPQITKDLRVDISNRHVLIVEDIVDTGYSLDFLNRLLKERNPASLKTLLLLSKLARREVDVKLDYVGFEIKENKWVEGYGLDSGFLGRGNPDIIEKLA